jgi:tetratricopeptide (TPR) repeat protein
MKETQILAWITAGETETLDFKRELALQHAEGKAELVKDVIAIANTAADTGYLLVGVDKSGLIVGIENLEEERIQQVVHTYINPKISLKCDIVPIAGVGFLNVGVLSIRGLERPHRVARAIGRLRQDQVFVRRGTTTAEASPDELYRMRETTSELQRNIEQYVRAAEKHFRLGNAELAIKAYSEAIALDPVPEYFIARGAVYALYAKPGMEDWLDDDIAKTAYKDFSDALALADSTEIIKAARLGRLRICSLHHFSEGHGPEDFEWLMPHTEGKEQGEVLYLKQSALYKEGFYTNGESEEMSLDDLERAIRLGYKSAEIYLLRGVMHLWDINYGLALEDLDRVIAETQDRGLICNCQWLRAKILLTVGKYEEALDAFIDAEDSPEGAYYHSRLWALPLLHELTERIFYEVSIADLLDSGSPLNREIYRQVLIVLLARLIRARQVMVFGDREIPVPPTTLQSIAEEYPKIIDAIREVVGSDVWQNVETDVPLHIVV